jgi:hypothetical protein
VCPVGRYCPAGSLQPLLCPNGTYGGSVGLGTSSCSGPCPGGYTCGDGTVNSTSSPCPPGRYSGDGEGKPSCTGDCAPGFYCPGASTSPTQVRCPAGTVADGGPYGSAACGGPCPAGFLCPLAALKPVPCPPGRLCNAPGLASVDDASACPAGQYCPGQTVSAIPCPPSFYCAVNTSQPTLCGPGVYCAGGATGPSGTGPCAAGSDPGASGQSTPTCSRACPAGRYCSGGGAGSLPCGEGSYCPEGSVSPLPCPPGTFGNTTEVSACPWSAEPGYWTPAGSTNGTVRPCRAGVYSDGGAGSETCKGPCARGHYCPALSTSPTMVPCPPGSFAAVEGAQSLADCQPVEAGRFSGAGAAVSSPCPPGTFSPAPGVGVNASCAGLCEPGFFCPPGSTSPRQVPCPPGVHGPAPGNVNSTCLGPCPRGKWCGGATVEAQPCDPGFMCPGGDTAPTGIGPCPAGSVCPQNTRGGGPLALPCPLGAFCPQGSERPRPCPAGSVGNITSASTELCGGPAPRGYYAVEGSTEPLMCPAGTYGERDGLGTPQCSGPCFLGYSCPPGSLKGDAVPCPPGRFGGSRGLSDPLCSGPCAAGAYCGAASSSAVVALAPPGYYAAEGASEPSPCPRGRFGATSGLSTPGCSGPCDGGTLGLSPASAISTCGGACPRGHFCPPGSTEPTPCAAGTASAEPGLASSCPTCALGFVALDAGSVSCVHCPRGSVAPSPTSCVRCPLHTVGNFSHCNACAPGHWCDGTDVYKCYDTAPHCLGRACEDGYTGPLCGVCERGFYRADAGGTCRPCSDHVWQIFVGMTGVLGLLAFGFVLLYARSRAFWSAYLSTDDVKLVGSLFGHHVQRLVLLNRLALAFPPDFQTAMAWFATMMFGGLEIAGPECVVSAWSFTTFWLLVVFLVAFALVVAVFAEFPGVCARRRREGVDCGPGCVPQLGDAISENPITALVRVLGFGVLLQVCIQALRWRDLGGLRVQFDDPTRSYTEPQYQVVLGVSGFVLLVMGAVQLVQGRKLCRRAGGGGVGGNAAAAAAAVGKPAKGRPTQPESALYTYSVSNSLAALAVAARVVSPVLSSVYLLALDLLTLCAVVSIYGDLMWSSCGCCGRGAALQAKFTRGRETSSWRSRWLMLAVGLVSILTQSASVVCDGGACEARGAANGFGSAVLIVANLGVLLVLVWLLVRLGREAAGGGGGSAAAAPKGYVKGAAASGGIGMLQQQQQRRVVTSTPVPTVPPGSADGPAPFVVDNPLRRGGGGPEGGQGGGGAAPRPLLPLGGISLGPVSAALPPAVAAAHHQTDNLTAAALVARRDAVRRLRERKLHLEEVLRETSARLESDERLLDRARRLMEESKGAGEEGAVHAVDFIAAQKRNQALRGEYSEMLGRSALAGEELRTAERVLKALEARAEEEGEVRRVGGAGAGGEAAVSAVLAEQERERRAAQAQTDARG